MKRLFTALGSALLVIHPNLGVLVLGSGAFVERALPKQLLWWGAALAAPLLIPVPFQLLAGQAVSWVLLQALSVAVFVIISVGRRKYVAAGLLTGLVGLVAVGFGTASKRAEVIDGHSPNLVAQFRGISVLNPRSMYWSVSKEWEAEEALNGVILELDLRLSQGMPGNDWYRYHPKILVVPCEESVTSNCSLVTVPKIVDSDGVLMISRELDTGAPLGGRTFRLSANLRSDMAQVTFGCNGIRLQDNGGKSDGECAPVSLTPDWEQYSIDWTAPPNLQGTELRVVVSNIMGMFEIADVVVEERTSVGWQRLGPMEPLGLQLGVRSAGVGRRDVPAHTLVPTLGWERHTVYLDTEGHVSEGIFRLNFLVEGNVGVEIRNLVAFPVGGGQELRPIAEQRWELGYGQPNLLGHSAVIMGSGVALLGQSLLMRSVGFLAAGVLVLQSGSRTALLALLLVTVLLMFAARSRWLGIALICALGISGIALLAANPETALRFLTLSDGNNATRSEIWSVAIDVFRERPLTGLGAVPFSENWVDNGYGWSNTAPTHAHNFVLQLGSSYGIPGLVASIGFLAVLARLCWMRMRWLGMLLIAAVLLLNTFDFTLVFPGVLSGLLLITHAGSVEK